MSIDIFYQIWISTPILNIGIWYCINFIHKKREHDDIKNILTLFSFFF